MEKDPEISNGTQDFGARKYDGRIARWFSVDKFDSKYPFASPYSFALNNPTLVVDIGGDSIWIEKGEYSYDPSRKVFRAVTTIHLELKVLDVSMRGFSDAELKDIIKQTTDNLNRKLSQSVTKGAKKVDGNFINKVEQINFVANITMVTSMNSVEKSDHLLVLVDESVFKTVDKDGNVSSSSGVATRGGKIAYVQTYPSWFSKYTETNNVINTMIHEIGHLLGFKHSWEDGLSDTNTGKNYMDYTKTTPDEGEFSSQQITQLYYVATGIGLLKSEAINGGSNSEIQSEDDSNLYNHSTNEEPWKDSVKKGDRIPFRITGKNGDKCCSKRH
jgi:RHS repeat-associated protein